MGRWMFAVCVWFCGISARAEEALLEGSRLFVPVVNTEGEVAKYQNATFSHVDGADWRLLSVDETGRDIALAMVTDVSPRVTDTFPAHVLLRVVGEFFCGCENLGRVTQQRDENRFSVVINNGPCRTGVGCVMGPERYTTSIALPVYGLPAGEYSYDVNGITGTFELPRDNALAGDCPYVSEEWCRYPGFLVDLTITVTPSEEE